jgi:hypothetical protein
MDEPRKGKNMENVIYRKIDTGPWSKALQSTESAGEQSSTSASASRGELSPLSAELFYPQVTTQEMETWVHWLPTAITLKRSQELAPEVELSLLTTLDAPPEVLEEFHWSWKIGLFEAYEIRTPVRRDARDPLLLGIQGGQRYRIALWGESLMPLEKIAALVQESLAIKARAARWSLGLSIGGALMGLLLGWWLGFMTGEGKPQASMIFFTMLGLFFGWFPTVLHTPENRQHDFLDQYR